MNRAIKILISSLLLCGLWAQADDFADSWHKELEQFRTPCHNELFKATRINIMKIPNKTDTTLEGRYCPRILLRTVGDAYAEGFDVPADQLNVNIEPIQWANEKSGNFDLSALDDVNTQAAQVWQKMIQCHGTAEKARRAYFEGSSKCGTNALVKGFAQSVQLYLGSTQTFLRGHQIKGRFHPLLTQLLLENISTTTWLPGITDESSASRYFSEEALKYLVRGGTLEMLENMTQEETVQSNCFCLALKLGIKQPGVRALLLRLNRTVNAFMLLSSNQSLQECEVIGLWPAVSRAVVKSFSSDSKNSALGSARLSETVAKACGDVRYTDSPYSFSTRPSYAIVQLFREMAMRDFP